MTLVEKTEIVKELAQVVDPEVGVPITESDLVDDIGIDNETGVISIGFHLTAPFCPPMFALEIAQDIKKRVSALEGEKEVKISMTGHLKAEEINTRVNTAPAAPATSQT